jgi:hypothetical protein
MKTGIVKAFRTNERGGFGFLTLNDGTDLYFQRNDGGPVYPGATEPKIQHRRLVREPRPGDLVLFFGTPQTEKGHKAAPWCFWEEWTQALETIIHRPTYRLMVQVGKRVLGNTPPGCLWQGSDLRQIKSRVFEIHLTTQYSGDHWIRHWFEIQTETGDWQKIDGDPREQPVEEMVSI